MAAILSTNMASLYAQKNLSTAQASLSESVQRLSSGTRINSAKDDAAGYGIAESVRGTKNIVDQNIRNAKDGISWAQTAEGALDVVGKMLQRALTLTTQGTNSALNDTQRASIEQELTAIAAEIVNISERTKFQGGSNSMSVFDLSGNSIEVQTGADDPTVVTARMIDVADLLFAGGEVEELGLASFTQLNAPAVEEYPDVETNTTGDGTGLTVNFIISGGGDGAPKTLEDFELNDTGSGYSVGDTITVNLDGSGNYITTTVDSLVPNFASTEQIETLIAENASNRGTLGAAINSLEYAVDNMQTLSTNLADGISRIVDTDYAAETSNLTRTQIMQQAATSMLAQANQMPNVILTLLK
jgi:flagellin